MKQHNAPARGKIKFPMETNSKHLNKILIQRLKEKGVGSNKIDGLIRNLANLYFANPNINLSQINKKLKSYMSIKII